MVYFLLYFSGLTAVVPTFSAYPTTKRHRLEKMEPRKENVYFMHSQNYYSPRCAVVSEKLNIPETPDRQAHALPTIVYRHFLVTMLSSPTHVRQTLEEAVLTGGLMCRLWCVGVWWCLALVQRSHNLWRRVKQCWRRQRLACLDGGGVIGVAGDSCLFRLEV